MIAEANQYILTDIEPVTLLKGLIHNILFIAKLNGVRTSITSDDYACINFIIKNLKKHEIDISKHTFSYIKGESIGNSFLVKIENKSEFELLDEAEIKDALWEGLLKVKDMFRRSSN